jgi:hypothetical protein
MIDRAHDSHDAEPSKHPVFVASAETIALRKRLITVPIGETLTYPEISRITHRNPQSKEGRGIVYSAIDYVLHEHQMVFGCVANVGYKRLNDSEITELGQAYIETMRRKAKNGSTKLATVEPASLHSDKRTLYFLAATICAATAEALTQKRLRLVGKAVGNSGSLLSYKDTILALGD